MGVPKVMDFWVDNITNFIIDDINIEIKNKKDWDITTYNFSTHGQTDIYVKKYVSNGSHVMSVISDSTDYNGLFQNNNYKEFPLFEPELTIILYTVPDNVYESTVKHIRAAFHPSKVKLVKSGGLKLFTGVKFQFTVPIPESNYNNGVLDSQKIRQLLEPSVSHELHHAYQEYNELLKGRKLFKQSPELTLNRVSQELRNIVDSEEWTRFLYLVYLHLSFELNARITQLSYTLKNKNINNTTDFFNHLKTTQGWEEYELLKNFDSDTFYNSLKNDVIINNTFWDDQTDFDADLAMSEIIKGWDDTIKNIIVKNNLHNIDTDHIKPISKNMIENPKLFFDFFEKRFHRKAEDYRRKILKLINLYI